MIMTTPKHSNTVSSCGQSIFIIKILILPYFFKLMATADRENLYRIFTQINTSYPCSQRVKKRTIYCCFRYRDFLRNEGLFMQLQTPLIFAMSIKWASSPNQFIEYYRFQRPPTCTSSSVIVIHEIITRMIGLLTIQLHTTLALHLKLPTTLLTLCLGAHRTTVTHIHNHAGSAFLHNIAVCHFTALTC